VPRGELAFGMPEWLLVNAGALTKSMSWPDMYVRDDLFKTYVRFAAWVSRQAVHVTHRRRVRDWE
jgi:hypothetical protein